MLRERTAFELPFGDADTSLLVSAMEFPYFYALLGDRNPKNPPSAGTRGEKRLATDVFALAQSRGPITEGEMMEQIGGSVSQVTLARTLHDLWADLRTVRTDARTEADAPAWNVLYNWTSEPLSQAIQILRT